ncbi:MAG: DUF4956 domain-containing protein [Pyrinomonadaceae bacterium]
MKRARLAVLIAVLFAAALVVLLFVSQSRNGSYKTGNTSAVSNTQNSNTAQATDEGNPFLSMMSGSADTGPAPETENWAESSVRIIMRLLLAVVLSGILAFRPRKDIHLFKRSLFVSQTQILLSVVAAALMMIVGDNAARAFAIFAAVSLVRFRTNIRDPKEVTVLLISLALGLAAGVGRWDLGISLCLFALALLWLLEFNESENVFRSMELTIKTKDTDRTQEILKKIFKRKRLDAEVRELDAPDEKNPIGSIVYYLNLPLKLRTDDMSDRILAADPENIEKIQWSKTKSAADIYQ